MVPSAGLEQDGRKVEALLLSCLRVAVGCGKGPPMVSRIDSQQPGYQAVGSRVASVHAAVSIPRCRRCYLKGQQRTGKIPSTCNQRCLESCHAARARVASNKPVLYIALLLDPQRHGRDCRVRRRGGSRSAMPSGGSSSFLPRAVLLLGVVVGGALPCIPRVHLLKVSQRVYALLQQRFLDFPPSNLAGLLPPRLDVLRWLANGFFVWICERGSGATSRVLAILNLRESSETDQPGPQAGREGRPAAPTAAPWARESPAPPFIICSTCSCKAQQPVVEPRRPAGRGSTARAPREGQGHNHGSGDLGLLPDLLVHKLIPLSSRFPLSALFELPDCATGTGYLGSRWILRAHRPRRPAGGGRRLRPGLTLSPQLLLWLLPAPGWHESLPRAPAHAAVSPGLAWACTGRQRKDVSGCAQQCGQPVAQQQVRRGFDSLRPRQRVEPVASCVSGLAEQGGQIRPANLSPPRCKGPSLLW